MLEFEQAVDLIEDKYPEIFNDGRRSNINPNFKDRLWNHVLINSDLQGNIKMQAYLKNDIPNHIFKEVESAMNVILLND